MIRSVASPSQKKLDDALLVLLAWAVAGLIVFVSLGAAPLTDLDEGAFSEASREMLVRADWVSPWLLDAPRFDKPVLIHWLQMISFQWFGLNSFAARLPSAIMGLLWIGGMAGWAYLVADRLLPKVRHRVYGWAVLIGSSCLGVATMSRVATADATLNAFLVLTLLMVWRALWPRIPTNTTGATEGSIDQSSRIWIRLAAICLGLGLLTKGPIALLVPAAASLLAALWAGQFKRWLKLVLDVPAWGLVLLVAGPWYLLQLQAQGLAFVQGFLGLHNLGRFTNTMHGFSAGPLYYPAWLMIATLPWTPVVLGTLVCSLGRGSLGQLLRRPELRLSWAVLIFVLVFFSFSATKLPHYGFYGLSGLVVLMSLSLGSGLGLFGQPWFRTLILLVPFGLIGLLLTVPAALSLSAVWSNGALARWTADWQATVAAIQDPYYRQVLGHALSQLQADGLLMGAMICAALGALLAGLKFFRTGLLTLALLAGLTIHAWLVPTVMRSLRDPVLYVGQFIKSQVRLPQGQAPSRVITWRLTAPSLSFAAERVIPAAEPRVGDWVVMPSHLIDELVMQQSLRVEVIIMRTGIALVALAALPSQEMPKQP